MPTPTNQILSESIAPTWREQLQAQADILDAAADQKQAQIEPLLAEIKALRQAASAIRSGMSTPRRGPQPTGRWSKKYDACIECGRSDLRHAGNGRCHNCYHREFEQARKAKANGKAS